VTVGQGPGHQAAHRRDGRQGARRRHARSRSSPCPRQALARRLADKDTLSGRASRALGWSFGSTLLTKLSLFGIGVMLARLLGPHAFGTYAVAYVALLALLTFNELGVSLAIVRWPGDPDGIVPTVTTISVFVSSVIFACCFFLAPVYTSAMGAPAATGVIRVLALTVLSDAFTNTPVALLQRSFRQRQRVIADQVNIWLGTGTTVALAWSGDGVMSLAVGRLVGCVAGAVLLVAFAPGSLRLGFDPAKARALLRFGLPLAGANIIAFGVATVDQLVVGHVLGAVALGFYVLALNLAGWPINIFSQPVRSVGPAVFARLQHDPAAMRATFMSAAGLLCAVALPVCLLIGGSARPLIVFVYGDRWLPAARPLMWLALLGAVQVFLTLAYDYFVVLARSRFLLAVQLAWLVALVGGLVAGARAAGIYGASLAELAVAAFIVLPWYLAGLSRAGIRLRSLSRYLRLPVAGAAATGAAAMAAARVAPTDFTALAASGVAMAAVVGLLAYRMRSVLSLLRSPSAGPVPARAADPAAAGPARAAGDPAGLPPADAHWHGRHARTARPPDPIPPLPPPHDSTGPLPAYRDVLGYLPARQDLDVTSPLYLRTIASLCWDPAAAAAAEPAADQAPRGNLPRRLSLTMGQPQENGHGTAPATADFLPDTADFSLTPPTRRLHDGQ
jgi:O-antigen/teichoic acid export membrane protein